MTDVVAFFLPIPQQYSLRVIRNGKVKLMDKTWPQLRTQPARTALHIF